MGWKWKGTGLTLKCQIFAEVDLHGLFRAFCASFGIVNNGFLADSKPDHWRVLRPVLDVCRYVILLFQYLLKDVVGCTCAHGDSCATTFDANPSYQVTDGEVMSIVWMGWKEVQAIVGLEEFITEQ